MVTSTPSIWNSETDGTRACQEHFFSALAAQITTSADQPAPLPRLIIHKRRSRFERSLWDGCVDAENIQRVALDDAA